MHFLFQSSLKFHPDKNPGASEIYRTIQVAYTILSDPEKRTAYDVAYQARRQRERIEQSMSEEKKRLRMQIRTEQERLAENKRTKEMEEQRKRDDVCPESL